MKTLKNTLIFAGALALAAFVAATVLGEYLNTGALFATVLWLTLYECVGNIWRNPVR